MGYWEPAKFVAKLREYKTDSNMLLFKCEMGAGMLIAINLELTKAFYNVTLLWCTDGLD